MQSCTARGRELLPPATDYVVEFLGYRFGFNALDFEQRVTAAAVKLGLARANELDEDETADLVELAADGRIERARSALGRYLVRHWERLSLVEGESLVYWLRKLVFRGAWLDHRVKEDLLEVDWDDETVGVRLPRPARRAAPCSSSRPCPPGTSSSSGARPTAPSAEKPNPTRLSCAAYSSIRSMIPIGDDQLQAGRPRSPGVGTERDEAVTGLRQDRVEREARAVRQRDLDHGLLDAALLGEAPIGGGCARRSPRAAQPCQAIHIVAQR